MTGKREIIAPAKKDEEISNLTKTVGYSVDLLKRVYINSDITLEQLAKEYDLPLSVLTRYAKSGAKSWHTLQKECMERRIQTLQESRGDLLIEKQSTVQRMENLFLMRLNMRMADIEHHFKTYGDFYVRDAEGEILRDGRGQPIELILPVSTKELLSLKGLEDARETNHKLLGENQAVKQLGDGKTKNQDGWDGETLDIDDYIHTK